MWDVRPSLSLSSEQRDAREHVGRITLDVVTWQVAPGWVSMFRSFQSHFYTLLAHFVPRDVSQVSVLLFAKYDIQKDENRCALKI